MDGLTEEQAKAEGVAIEKVCSRGPPAGGPLVSGVTKA